VVKSRTEKERKKQALSDGEKMKVECGSYQKIWANHYLDVSIDQSKKSEQESNLILTKISTKFCKF